MSDPYRRRKVMMPALEQFPAGAAERFGAIIGEFPEDALHQPLRDRTLWLAGLADVPTTKLTWTDANLMAVIAKMKAWADATAKALENCGWGADAELPTTKAHSIDYQYAAQVLLIVLIWLITLAMPAYAYKSGWSSDAQAMVDGYDALVASIAVTMTAAILAKHKHK